MDISQDVYVPSSNAEQANLNPSIVSHTWKDAKKCLVSKFDTIYPRDVIAYIK